MSRQARLTRLQNKPKAEEKPLLTDHREDNLEITEDLALLKEVLSKEVIPNQKSEEKPKQEPKETYEQRSYNEFKEALQKKDMYKILIYMDIHYNDLGKTLCKLSDEEQFNICEEYSIMPTTYEFFLALSVPLCISKLKLPTEKYNEYLKTEKIARIWANSNFEKAKSLGGVLLHQRKMAIELYEWLSQQKEKMELKEKEQEVKPAKPKKPKIKPKVKVQEPESENEESS
jgi:hypothetical protein